VKALHITGPRRSDWQDVEIEDSLDALQAAVGGYIEGIRGPSFMLYLNEEGRLMGLPPTLCSKSYGLIVGNAIVLGPPDAEGDNTGLTPAGRAEFERLFLPAEDYVPQNSPFKLGRTLITPGAQAYLEKEGVDPASLLDRHHSGDWGIVDAEDKAANDRALIHGERLLSAYPVGDGKVWVITEWDRSATTILLPEEY
jgi:hypothetical protein